MQQINRTLIYSLVIIGFFMSLICIFLLIVVYPNSSSTLISFISTLPALAGSVAALLYSQVKIGQKVETVKQQTNGTLSALVKHATGQVPLSPEQLTAVAQAVGTQSSTIEGK